MSHDCVEPLPSLSKWVRPAFLTSFLESIGFGFIPTLTENLKDFKHDNNLIRVLVDYYDEEEHCFKINNKRLFIGLTDVKIITGLPVVGRPVACKMVKGWRELCKSYLGVDLPDNVFDKDTRGKLKPKLVLSNLYKHFDKMLVDEGGNLEEGTEKWKRYIRAFWLHFIGCYIAPDSSKGKVPVHYLWLLDNVEDIGLYAWGAASWVLLVEGLKKKSVNTLGASLIVFMLEFVPPLRDKVLEIALSPIPTELPLLSSWGGIMSKAFKSTVHMNLIIQHYRSLLDNLDKFENNPYNRLDLRLYGDELVKACRDTICFNMTGVEAHMPSKFHMQYGYRTLVPSSTTLPPINFIIPKKGPKKDLDVLADDRFKAFLGAWQEIHSLKGELLDGWSVEKAPWLVEETVQAEEQAFSGSSLGSQQQPTFTQLLTSFVNLNQSCTNFDDSDVQESERSNSSHFHYTTNFDDSDYQETGVSDDGLRPFTSNYFGSASSLTSSAHSANSRYTINSVLQDCVDVKHTKKRKAGEEVIVKQNNK